MTTTTSKIASIVVGTDFTPCSAVALGQAIRIARHNASKVHVVHFIDSSVVVELESAFSPSQQNIKEKLIANAKNTWEEFASHIDGARDLQLDVDISNRITGILSRTTQAKADLLVLGAFGDRKPDVGFGTVATSCVRAGATDVLLVRDTQRGAFKTIVAAVDFSDTSAKALARAAMVAHQDAAQLHVLHVFFAPWHNLHFKAPTEFSEPHLQKQYFTALNNRLTDFTSTVRAAYPDLRVKTTCLDYSQHRFGIVQYAQNVSADLITLGTRANAYIRDFVLGSTAEKVLQQSHCSVLAVKP